MWRVKTKDPRLGHSQDEGPKMRQWVAKISSPFWESPSPPRLYPWSSMK